MPEMTMVAEPAVKEGHMRRQELRAGCRVAVIWIDWYAYHLARFRGLLSTPELAGGVAGIELVGGVGVHAGLKFREGRPAELPVETLMPESSWQEAGQWRLASKLWRHLSRLSPEVVLVPGYYTVPAIAAAVWARVHGRTSVLMTESTSEDHSRTWWKEKAKSWLIWLLFDWAIAGGAAHRRYLRMLGVEAERIAGSYDVVDNEFFAQASAELRQRDAEEFGLPERYFLYVGRLAPEKNVKGLLAAWTAYREAGGLWPLVLVGDGPSGASLREAAKASKFAADVHFAGLKSSLELAPWYAFAGCFVLPSTREPWGLVVNEAMAAGLPVLVSSRCGCAEDLVAEGGNGFVFAPTDLSELSGRLREISGLSVVERQQMGAASAAIVHKYSPRSFGEEVARIYAAHAES